MLERILDPNHSKSKGTVTKSIQSNSTEKSSTQFNFTEPSFDTDLKMDLPNRKQTHIARKLWHVIGVGAVTLLFYILPYNVSIGLVSGFSILFIGLDLLRFKVPVFKRFVTKIMFLFIRKEELQKPTGLSYMCLGFWLLMIFCDEDVALLTMLFVMLGDPIAAYVGINYGRDKIGDKTVQGFLACFAVCAIISLVFLTVNDFNMSRVIYVSLLAALIGSGSELVQIKRIDDNLSMPVISGLLLTLLFALTA